MGAVDLTEIEQSEEILESEAAPPEYSVSLQMYSYINNRLRKQKN
jgi:hypothetical protein